MSPRMNTSWIPIAALLIAAGAALLIPVARGAGEGPRSLQIVDLDQFHGQVDGEDYLRNPDKTPRELFSNASGQTVALTFIGNKNLRDATTLYPEVGPIEIRAGAEARTSQLIGVIPRRQPVFALHVTVPAGDTKNPVQVYMWNADRTESATVNWKVEVE